MSRNRIVLALFGLVMLAALVYAIQGVRFAPERAPLDRAPTATRPAPPGSAAPAPAAPMPEPPQANIPPPRPLGLPDSAPNRK